MRQEMLRFARVLLEQTEQDRIKWTTTDEGNEFLFSSTKSSILIQGEFGDYEVEDEGDFSLVLLNRGGSVAARLEIGYEAFDYDAPNYLLMKNLYFTVQNKALEIDTTLEDMKQALGMEGFSPASSDD